MVKVYIVAVFRTVYASLLMLFMTVRRRRRGIRKYFDAQVAAGRVTSFKAACDIIKNWN